MKNNYTERDLITLEAGEGYRKKIGMYLSGDMQEAINLGLRELIVNAQDEYEVYKPTNAKLIIDIDTKTRVIKVIDNLRGIPVGVRDDGVNSLEAAFLIPHSGAKHEEGAYVSSVGINGQGAKIVCHTAEFLTVVVHREQRKYRLSFESDEKGAYIKNPIEEGENPLDKTGTYIEYRPDPRVYGDVFIDLTALRLMLNEMSWFTKGLAIELTIDGETESFFSENGLIDGLNYDDAISPPFSISHKANDCEVELALQWVKHSRGVRGYANGLHMPDGGVFMTAFRTAVTRQFNKLAGSSFTGGAIRGHLAGFCSVKVKLGQFTNQQKTALANTETREPVSYAVRESFKNFSKMHKADFEKIVEMLTRVEKAEAAAERARIAVLESTKEIERTVKRKVFASDKLKDSLKTGQDSILLLAEGKSAVGALSQARDPERTGLLEIRGKIINAMTNDEEKVLQNEEVQLIFSALGQIPGKYNARKLRYGKVGIATDADSDGEHITLLLLAFFAVYLPEMLKEGRIFKLEAPTHIVQVGQKSHYFFGRDEFENRKVQGSVTLLKGLGEFTADQMKESMFGENQRLTNYKWSEEAYNTLVDFMSTDVEPRREFLFNEVDFSKVVE